MKLRINIVIESDLKERITADAERDRRSMNQQIIVLCEEALAARKEKAAA